MWGYAYDAVRLTVAAALLVAGGSKVVSPRPLATSLRQVFGWARPAGIRVARIVAALELAAALMLAGAWGTPIALALTGVVGAGIVVFVLTAVRRGATAPCGCFGESSGKPIGTGNLLAGVGLLAGTGLLAAAGPPLLPATVTAGAALMLPLTAVTAMLAVMVRDRARLVAPFRRHFEPLPAVPVPPHRRQAAGRET